MRMYDTLKNYSEEIYPKHNFFWDKFVDDQDEYPYPSL